MLPKVSVVLPVYNAALYVKEAVQSVLNQTFQNFELLIYNDGSTDNSLEILQQFEDSRIRIVNYEKNIGLIQLLNNAFSEAKGEYIARMDADDVCLPDRFEKQVGFLDQHPNIGICGGFLEIIGTNEINKKPALDKDLRWWIFKGSPFAHPSVMIRNKVLIHSNLKYNPDAYVVEDFDLWWRMAFVTQLANLETVLLKYRIHPNQVSSSKNDLQLENLRKSQIEFMKNLGISAAKYDPDFINKMLSRELICTANNFKKTWMFFKDLLSSKDAVEFFGVEDIQEKRFKHASTMINNLIHYKREMLSLLFDKEFTALLRNAGIQPIIFFFKSLIQWKTKTTD